MRESAKIPPIGKIRRETSNFVECVAEELFGEDGIGTGGDMEQGELADSCNGIGSDGRGVKDVGILKGSSRDHDRRSSGGLSDGGDIRVGENVSVDDNGDLEGLDDGRKPF